jgi:large subunit ribosomal protein L10
MDKGKKEQVVAELTERLRQAETLLIADYRGLSVTEIDALRTELLKHGARFSVVKNTLTRRAAEAAGVDGLLALLDGPTAIAFLESDGDPVAVSKALAEAARTTRVLEVRGGLFEGRPISEAEISELAKLPPAEILRGQVLGAIVGPLQAIAGLVNAPLQNLYGLLEARIEQLEQQGGGAATEVPGDQAEEAPTAGAPVAEESPAEEPTADEPQATAEVEAVPEEAEEPALPADEHVAAAEGADAPAESDTDVTESEE